MLHSKCYHIGHVNRQSRCLLGPRIVPGNLLRTSNLHRDGLWHGKLSHGRWSQSQILSSIGTDKHEVDVVALHSAAAAAQTLPYSGKKAVVVGAGPGGSTAAMVLARQGFSVDVYERRPEPEKDAVDTGRAYIIALIPRGQATLERLGIPLPSGDYYQSLGTVRHPEKGAIRVTQESGNRTFSRNDLAQILINEARSRYPSQITFHFGWEASQIDLSQKKVVFTSPGQPEVVPEYDLLVGADGTGSRVRAAMQECDNWTAEVSDSGREYKVYQGLHADIEPPEFKTKKGATLHLYTTNDSFTTVTAHRNPDGSYSGTFSLRTGNHAKYTSQEAYEALLREKFSTLPQHWIPEIAKQASQTKASSAGKRIKCQQLHSSNNALVLGDAAHAVTPVFGQGANSALESCRVLDDVLTACTNPATGKGDPNIVPGAFSNERKADVHALWWIDAAAYSFFAKRPGVDFFALLAHVLVGSVLGKLLPRLYGPKPALLSLGSPSMPYSKIYKAVQRDATAVLVGFLVLVAFLMLKLAGVL